MKKQFLFPILLAMVISSFIACKKSDDSNNNNTTPKVTMTAKVNNIAWKTTSIFVSRQVSSPAEYTIMGEDTISGKNITLYLFTDSAKVHNYIADGGEARGMYNFSYSYSGNVNVTAISGGYITGTFNFATLDTNVVSEGAFTAQLP